MLLVDAIGSVVLLRSMIAGAPTQTSIKIHRKNYRHASRHTCVDSSFFLLGDFFFFVAPLGTRRILPTNWDDPTSVVRQSISLIYDQYQYLNVPNLRLIPSCHLILLWKLNYGVKWANFHSKLLDYQREKKTFHSHEYSIKSQYYHHF